MKVLKFGGSSLANSKSISKVIKIIHELATKSRVIVVVSAMGKTTDKLIASAISASENKLLYLELFKEVKKHHLQVIDKLINSSDKDEISKVVKEMFKQLLTLLKACFLLKEVSPKTMASLSSFGELLSSYIIYNLAKHNLDANYKDSRELIITSNYFDKAQVNFELTNANCLEYFNKSPHRATILPGFIARTKNGRPSTLGRGGSDYTAAIYAAALEAEELQIWTDVSGMFTANPAVVKQAFAISQISYQEAMELSHFGAKVIYPPTIQPVLEKEIPVLIKNTFEPKSKGTLITKKSANSNSVKGISHIQNISLLTLQGSGMVGVSGISKRLFEALSNQGVNVVLITQASSEHSICVGIYQEDAKKAAKAINCAFDVEIERRKISPVVVEQKLSIIALVGDNMKNHQGLSGKMFSTLGRNNVNIRAIAQGASQKNISAVIDNKDVKKALNTLHEQFFEDNVKQLNLFVTGVGNVGERFLAQINQQNEYLKENLKINIRVIGISNSKKMYFDDKGIDLDNWKYLLNNGESASVNYFFEKTKQLNLRNSVFVDNTANKSVAKEYNNYLSNSIAVVTCNKIACASNFENYKALKRISQKYEAPFLYETNVGAGLPIIDTIKNLIASGDRVLKIQAVLSGSLNFVFNNFSNKTTFCNIVLQAHRKGYTEPNPILDLSGIDVARKILILARESGYSMELADVKNKSFLPKEVLETTNNDDFYASLIKFESYFQKLLKQANTKKQHLKYIAELHNGKAWVGLSQISDQHPLNNISGSDNTVLFYTDRYPVYPLQIKGAGAGADVTAAGIFADVIRTFKS
ncbi:MAG: bifunctional aspartate kinase/homoserine dehydrogenase I [Tenacibaculum sp.]